MDRGFLVKILVVIPRLSFGGGAPRVISLLSQEWALNHEVLIAVFYRDGLVYPHGGKLVDLSCPPTSGKTGKVINVIKRIKRLRKLIGKERPDRIISFTEGGNFPAIFACVLSGNIKKLVVSVRGNPNNCLKLYKWLMRLLYPRVPIVVAVAPGVLNCLVGRYGVSPRKCYFISNPIGLKSVNDNSNKAELPANVPKGDYILAAGRLVKSKNFEALLSAFAIVRNYSHIKLLILGDGSERKNIEKKIRYLSLEKDVIMPGMVTDVFSYMSRAKMFVLSSHHEGWPNVIIEALACGCPVIAFDCPFGPKDILQHEKTGLLVPAGDIKGLSSEIIRLLNDEGLRLRILNNGKKVVKQWDAKSIAQKWIELDLKF